MAVMLLMEGGTKCIDAKDFYILISIVINVNLGIHCVQLQKLQSFLQPKIMERLLKFLPTTTFIIQVLNSVWGD